MAFISTHPDPVRARKVLNTPVKDVDGNRLGAVEDIVLDKSSNNVMFAVVGFGGFLGVGEKYQSIPWDLLDYDEGFGAYVIGLTKQDLNAAPATSVGELTAGVGHARNQNYELAKCDSYWSDERL